MDAVLKVSFYIGAMAIGSGAFLIHLGKSVGAGLLTFGIILLGISAQII